MDAFSFSDLTSIAGKQKTAKAQQSTSGNKSIATNDGLTVLSPEQYLGIDPCDDLSVTDDRNAYGYVYVNGAPELQTVRKMCTDANCNYGDCYACGGDGIR